MNNQIRFSAYDGHSLVHVGEWVPEMTKDCALKALAAIRKQLGGNYQYRIERTGDSKVPNPVKMYRYKIKVGEVEFYSRLLTENEKDEALAQIKSGKDKALARVKGIENAEITEEEI